VAGSPVCAAANIGAEARQTAVARAFRRKAGLGNRDIRISVLLSMKEIKTQSTYLNANHSDLKYKD
jgi:hypothetical protein